MQEKGFVKNSLKSLTRLQLPSGKAFFKRARPKMFSFAQNTSPEVKSKQQKAVSKLVSNALNHRKEIRLKKFITTFKNRLF